MIIKFENTFYRDLDNINDKRVLSKLEDIISLIKASKNINDLTSIK